MNEEYIIVDDENGHWYVIPADKNDDWYDGFVYGDDTFPEWAFAINGYPSLIKFTGWRHSWDS